MQQLLQKSIRQGYMDRGDSDPEFQQYNTTRFFPYYQMERQFRLSPGPAIQIPIVPGSDSWQLSGKSAHLSRRHEQYKADVYHLRTLLRPGTSRSCYSLSIRHNGSAFLLWGLQRGRLEVDVY